MAPGSRASELVNSYPTTAEKYVEAIASLKDRYGDNYLQIEIYMCDLLQFVLNS